ncbi:MAG: ABC transporter permease subunit [Chloroflexi bacterium]|nr:ABC transporter permease subunit [Chloroflexota bacterium]MBU1749994.1 ABC transporter permease subunit [Chloroflexota bacterium]MBU1877436.1 ABC transporter permease subunit [Chloroflexota bacterium]
MDKVLAIVEKEWVEVLRNKLILITMALLPLLFVAMVLGTIWMMQNLPAEEMNDAPETMMYLTQLPEYQGMTLSEIFVTLLLDQYLVYFLMIPLFVPMFIATYSIIGEKQARSLEPLLATPVQVWELLVGKVLAATIPAVLVTWLAYAISVVGAFLITSPALAGRMITPVWLLSILVLVPLITLFAVSLAVIISSRVNDIRLAEQLGGMTVIPFVGVSIAIMMGVVLLNWQTFLIALAVVAVLDVATVYLGAKLFRRETILTRWR